MPDRVRGQGSLPADGWLAAAEALPGPLRHRRRPGQRTRRRSRAKPTIPQPSPLWPGDCSASTNGATWNRRRGAELLFRCSQTENASVAVRRTRVSSGPAPSPTPGSAPRSWTGSPSKPHFETAPILRLRASHATNQTPPCETGKEHHEDNTTANRPGHRPRHRRLPAPPREPATARRVRHVPTSGLVPPRKEKSVNPLAEQAEHTRIDAYSQQTADGRHARAARHATPTHHSSDWGHSEETPHRPPNTGGARSQENTGASSD